MKEKIIIQRGWKRTCTNYVRSILEDNFDVKVITSNKHEPYVDYETLIRRTKGLQDTTGKYDESQSGWPHSIPSSLIDEYRSSNKIHHVICIKNPLSWVCSMCRLNSEGNIFSQKRPTRDIVREYSQRYERWLSLIHSHNDTSFIIRHEDVLMDFNKTMFQIQEKFNLNLRSDSVRDEIRVVIPQRKGSLSYIEESKFDKKFYKLKLYKDDLRDKNIYEDILDILKEEIDWDVLGLYGYDVDSL